MATLSPRQQIARNTEAAQAAKVANAPIVGVTTDQAASARSAYAVTDPRRTDLSNAGAGRGAPTSTQPATPTPPVISFNGNKADLRVKILVPSGVSNSYVSSNYTKGNKSNLNDLSGIIFPYTPQISLEHKAEYSSQNPMHSNYAINFYRHSMVSDISISGLFTVQNNADAINYLSTVHILRALTKMRFGGSDPLAGSPPPVCRLFAYGDFMLNNVPVAISSFKNDLPNDVDYFYLNDTAFGEAYVPVRSTIAVMCKPMYSRREMLDATVPQWLNNSNQRISGLL